MKKRSTFSVVTGGILLTLAINIPAQDGPQTRAILSDAYQKNRPASTKIVKKSRPTYGLTRRNKDVVKPKPSKPVVATPARPGKAALTNTQIGVTLWKLRAALSGENGYWFPVLDDKKLRQLWLAERTSLDSVLTAGDKVRLAIESSVPGYLYVIDREASSDGTFGDPFLIFPESGLDDNEVGPGILVDIPDQRDDLPYFNISPKRMNFAGELLTVIVSPRPLTGLTVDAEGKVTSVDYLSEIEFGSEVEVYSRSDNSDRIYSEAESASACGARTRQLEREKSAGRPCGVKTRQLTRDEPLPQSIFVVKGAVGRAAAAFVRMAVQ